jgi:hypothetical protein
MSDEELGSGGRVVDDATADANAEILAALDGVAGAGGTPAHAAPPDVRAAAASGASIGHGAIRLRFQRTPRLDDVTPGAVAPEAAAMREPVGHGTIRLLGERAAPAEQQATSPPDGAAPEPVEALASAAPAVSAPAEAASPGAPAVTEPVGHGTIRLLERDAPGAAETSDPVAPEAVGHGPIWLVERRLDIGTAATDDAVADIFAVLSAATS